MNGSAEFGESKPFDKSPLGKMAKLGQKEISEKCPRHRGLSLQHTTRIGRAHSEFESFWTRDQQKAGGAAIRCLKKVTVDNREDEMVGLGGLEPPTSPLSGARSSHLSYRPSRYEERLVAFYDEQASAATISKANSTERV